MPAYCSASVSTYEIYRKWCLDMHRTPPTREWWDHACTQPRPADRRLSDIEFDTETEHREGWTR